MKLSPDVFEETIDDARDYLAQGGADADRADAGLRARTFAEVLVQLGDRCAVGLSCDRHGGAVHGQEAEELRAGVEKILKEHASTPADVPYPHDDYEELRRSLIRLLDEVDARDSFAFLEATDPEGAEGAACGGG